jgi:hypothetical protein
MRDKGPLYTVVREDLLSAGGKFEHNSCSNILNVAGSGYGCCGGVAYSCS